MTDVFSDAGAAAAAGASSPPLKRQGVASAVDTPEKEQKLVDELWIEHTNLHDQFRAAVASAPRDARGLLLKPGKEAEALLVQLHAVEATLHRAKIIVEKYEHRVDVLSDQQGVHVVGTPIVTKNGKRGVVFCSGLKRSVALDLHVSYYVGKPPSGADVEGSVRKQEWLPAADIGLDEAGGVASWP